MSPVFLPDLNYILFSWTVLSYAGCPTYEHTYSSGYSLNAVFYDFLSCLLRTTVPLLEVHTLSFSSTSQHVSPSVFIRFSVATDSSVWLQGRHHAWNMLGTVWSVDIKSCQCCELLQVSDCRLLCTALRCGQYWHRWWIHLSDIDLGLMDMAAWAVHSPAAGVPGT